MDHIKIKTGTFWIEDDILMAQIDATNFHELGIEEAEQVEQVCLEIAAGRKYRCLVDLRNVNRIISLPALKFIAMNSRMEDLRISVAFVTNSFSIKLMASFLKKLIDNKCPVETFIELQPAIQWLNQQQPGKRKTTQHNRAMLREGSLTNTFFN